MRKSPFKELYEKDDESLQQLFSVSQQIHGMRALLNDLQAERNRLIVQAAENGNRPASIARIAEMNESWVWNIVKQKD